MSAPTLFDDVPARDGAGRALVEAVMEDGAATTEEFPTDPGLMLADIIREWQANGWTCTYSARPHVITGRRGEQTRRITLWRLP